MAPDAWAHAVAAETIRPWSYLSLPPASWGPPGSSDGGPPLSETAPSPGGIRHSVGRLSVLALAASALDRVFGILLLAVIAGVFGATHESDSYFLALVIPTTLGAALSEALYAA